MPKKYLFFGLLLISFLVVPLFLRAETTTDDIARQIASLKQQIADLQRQLAYLQGQKTGQSCYNFEKNFGVGANGKQVMALQTVLAREGLMPVPLLPMPMMSQNSGDDDDEGDNKDKEKNNKVTFTENMAAAVSALQEKYRSEILTPNGLTSPTGYVGPATRAKLNQLYGCNKVIPPIPGNLPPVISGVSGPTTLNVGQTETWIVNASDPENGTLNYSVIWGDESMATRGEDPIPLSATPTIVQQTTIFTHSYATTGTYYPKFKVTDNSGQSAQTSLSVVVGQNQPSPITVTSPNGGEQWVASSTHAITWRYDGATSDTKVDLYLDAEVPACVYSNPACLIAIHAPYVLDKNISANATYNWIVATDIVNNLIPAGNYKIRVCLAGSQTNCDSSDSYFTIVNAEAKGTVSGVVTFTQGNCMPGVAGSTSVSSNPCTTTKVAREIIGHPPVLAKDYGNDSFLPLNTIPVIARTSSNADGYYSVVLPPGEYSISVVENGREFCSLQTSNSLNQAVRCLVTVKQDQRVENNININYLATY